MLRFLIALGVVGALSLPASDTFLVSGGCFLGDVNCPNWTNAAGGSSAWVVASLSGKAEPNASGATHDIAYWNADSFTADQYSETTVLIGLSSGYVGPAVRFDSSGNGYGFLCGTGTIYKYTATAAASLQTGLSTCSDGDVVKMTATGTSTTTLKIFINTVQNGSDVTDSSSPWTSGAAGIDGYSTTGAAVTLWTGDDIGGPGVTFPAAIINAPIRCCKGIKR